MASLFWLKHKPEIWITVTPNFFVGEKLRISEHRFKNKTNKSIKQTTPSESVLGQHSHPLLSSCWWESLQDYCDGWFVSEVNLDFQTVHQFRLISCCGLLLIELDLILYFFECNVVILFWLWNKGRIKEQQKEIKRKNAWKKEKIQTTMSSKNNHRIVTGMNVDTWNPLTQSFCFSGLVGQELPHVKCHKHNTALGKQNFICCVIRILTWKLSVLTLLFCQFLLSVDFVWFVFIPPVSIKVKILSRCFWSPWYVLSKDLNRA